MYLYLYCTLVSLLWDAFNSIDPGQLPVNRYLLWVTTVRYKFYSNYLNINISTFYFFVILVSLLWDIVTLWIQHDFDAEVSNYRYHCLSRHPLVCLKRRLDMQCISHYLYARFISKFEVNSLYLSCIERTNSNKCDSDGRISIRPVFIFWS